jgi:phosphoglycolate phosphatase
MSPLPNRPIAIFDFDGTIADSLTLAIEQYNLIAPRFRTRPIDVAELPRLRRLGAAAAMREHGISLWKVPLLVRSMRKALHAHLDAISPAPGVVDAIRALHGAAVPCSVLSTNTNASITRFMERHDALLFEHVAGGASMFGKARALRRLLRRARLAPERVYYIGDEVRDVEAARGAGIRSIAVSWGYADRQALLESGPTHLVDHAGELLQLLTRG